MSSTAFPSREAFTTFVAEIKSGLDKIKFRIAIADDFIDAYSARGDQRFLQLAVSNFAQAN
jgi:hypothetical protein